jgi:hypothetical protein
MCEDEEPCRPPRDAEHLADRLYGIISADASVVQIPEELLAGQPSPRFGPVSVIVPVHGSTPHRRSSELFRNPKISVYDAIFMPTLSPLFGCP